LHRSGFPTARTDHHRSAAPAALRRVQDAARPRRMVTCGPGCDSIWGNSSTKPARNGIRLSRRSRCSCITDRHRPPHGPRRPPSGASPDRDRRCIVRRRDVGWPENELAKPQHVFGHGLPEHNRIHSDGTHSQTVIRPWSGPTTRNWSLSLTSTADNPPKPMVPDNKISRGTPPSTS